MRRPIRGCAAATLVTILGASAAPRAADPQPAARVEVQPARLDLATFSGQRDLRVLARVAPGAEPVVVIRGPAASEEFKRKTRVGPLWLNAGHVRIAGAPGLLLTFSRKPLDAIVSRAEADALQLDTQALRHVVQVTPADDGAAVLDSYIALQVRRGTYGSSHGEAARVERDASLDAWVFTVPWPRTAPAADYTVTVYGVTGGRVTGSATAPLTVAHVGLSAWLARQARQQAAAYGAIAVLVALSLGFGIDFLVTLARRARARPGPRGRGQTGAAFPAPGKLATTDQARR